MKTKLEILHEIIEQHQHKKLKCRNRKILIDVVTAQAIMLIYNNLKKEESKVKFMTCDWDKMAEFAWKRCNFSMS